MNVYFLVEGKTERKVYPKWLKYFTPQLQRVDSPSDVSTNNYYLISGGGYPSILDNHLVDAAHDVISVGKFDYFVLALDTDGIDAKLKREEVLEFIDSRDIDFGKCKYLVLPQAVCMETWFLGNRKVYPRNPASSECAEMVRHYNIHDNDPELMLAPAGYNGSIGSFHYLYLKSILNERHIRYSKIYPMEVSEPYYIKELELRLSDDCNSLNSMRTLFNFLYTLR